MKEKKVRVAILAEEPLGWGSGKNYFSAILNNYRWKGKDITYKVSTKFVYDKDILRGSLTVSDFDVLVVPGGGVGDGESIVKGLKCSRKVRKWKKHIAKFIQHGGGYLGICGGAALITDLKTANNQRKKFIETLYNNSSLDVSCVHSYYKDLALPIFYPSQRWHPEKIGATAFVFSFRPGETVDNKRIFSGGVPVDFTVDSSHPLFSGYDKKTVRMRWWGGPGLIVPAMPKRHVEVIARYPSVDFSTDTNTSIQAWIYTGSLFGLLKGLWRSLILIKKEKMSLRDALTFTFYLAGNWKKTNTPVTLDLSNRPSMTAEIYPNEHEGRILLCTAHPEYMIWYGGHIEEVHEETFNCIGNGFHQWKKIQAFEDEGLQELTSTWWLVRRCVVWASKISDEELPPIEPGKMTLEVRKILRENIYWDGSFIHQLKNI
jgi:putative intracellular protease/amidase